MARISKDELEYCRNQKACFECHSEGIVKAAVKFQIRRNQKVPLCRAHWYAYKGRASRSNASKYARRSIAKQTAGKCVFSGCNNRLIPPELLPPWMRERTCGMHGSFKAFRINRTAILRFIAEHCLKDHERSGKPQNIIFKESPGFIFLGLQYPGHYQTKCFSATELLLRYRQSINKPRIPLSRQKPLLEKH